jgi:hypothetical protein
MGEKIAGKQVGDQNKCQKMKKIIPEQKIEWTGTLAISCVFFEA